MITPIDPQIRHYIRCLLRPVQYERLVIIHGIHGPTQYHLLLVADTVDSTGFVLGFREGREQQRGEDGDDGDDDQQLNKSEALIKPKRPPRHA